MNSHAFSYIYQLSSQICPEKLWALLSDTNRLFKDIGEHPIQIANLTHSVKSGYKELTYEQLHRPDVWTEEPFQWEAPYYLSVRRNYKSGYFNYLNIAISVVETDSGSKISFRFSGSAKGIGGWLVTKMKFNKRFKMRLKKVVSNYEQSVLNKALPVKSRKYVSMHNPVRWNILVGQLAEKTNQPELSEKLIRVLQSSDEEDLKNISPVKISHLWGKPLNDVLKVMFYAAKLDILNFSWNVVCPDCSQVVQNCKSLIEVSDPLYCRDCDSEFQVDFHRSVQLTFRVHPLVRKLPGKKFCIGGPSQQAQIKLNAMLQPGQNRFVKVALEAGNYRFYCDKSRVSVHAVVKEGGLESALLTFSNDDRRVQFVELSPNPNLILQNRFSEPIIIKCENTDWENYSISASEITSWPIFRDLFPRELIRPKKQLPANNLTILFTDLFNSSELYNTNGDDSAVGLVMNHFDILQEVIEAERGSIVKTIGDAVMAVFPKPIYAVKAFNRAQDIFKNELRTDRPILLKAGIHTGNCVAVTLNNHIDYFGNTVNIASRLVEYAQGEEVVISNDAYECSELREFLASKRDKLKIHHFDASLKGFESHTFEAKRISMLNNHLRLVV